MLRVDHVIFIHIPAVEDDLPIRDYGESAQCNRDQVMQYLASMNM